MSLSLTAARAASPKPALFADSASIPQPVAKLSLLLVAAILAVFIATGIVGRDFGRHWDEATMQTDPARDMVDSGILIPRDFIYPSLNLWFNLAAALPETISSLRGGSSEAQPRSLAGSTVAKKKFLAVFDSPEYLLRLRALYVVLTSLVVVWVYGLARVWGGSPLEGVIAAAILGFSWEFSYHARWVAQDAVLTQFAALCLLLASVGRFRPEQRGWFVAAAVVAGLAAGMKYTAGLLILPILIAAIQARPPDASLRSSLKTLATLVLTAGLTYLATTPGTLLRPSAFRNGFLYNWKHYNQLGHGGYTVRPGLEHATRMVEYLGLTFFSPFPMIALALFSLSLLGVVALVRRHRMAAAVLLIFPAVYLLMFDRQKVMTVRNLLAVTPVLAVFAARGAATLWDRIRLVPARIVLAATLVVALAVNAGWLVNAAGTIQDRKSDRFLREAVAYISAHPGQKFFVTPTVRKWLTPLGLTALANVTTTPTSSDVVLFSLYRDSYEDENNWPANQRTLLLTWFGP